LELRTAVLVLDVTKLLRSLSQSYCSPFHVTPLQFRVLLEIGIHQKCPSQTDLAKALGVGKVTVGEVVTVLKERGLLVRELRAFDRRFYNLELSACGRILLKKLSIVARQINREIISELTESDRQFLGNALEKVKAKLELQVDFATELGPKKGNQNGNAQSRSIAS